MQSGKQNGSPARSGGNGGQKQSSNRPVHTVRFGALKAAVWLNDTSVGPIHNVTVTRSYKDGDTWKDSGSFGYDDLLPLAKALNAAHSWINEQRQRGAESRGSHEHEEDEIPV
ncbi:MAG: hypothetical protein M5U22_23260 [Thermoleophilia bacterium]|nr:hypothetical protein [Thermoleophilia bacterium]